MIKINIKATELLITKLSQSDCKSLTKI